MSIDQFKAALVGGGARSNQFRISLTFPGIVSGGTAAPAIGLSEFMCTATKIPGSKLEKVTAHYRGRPLSLPAERTIDDWRITVLNDTNFAIHSAFNVWSNLINNVKSNTGVTNPATLTTDMYVTQLDRNGAELKTYKLIGVWPVEIEDLDLDFKNNEIQTFGVSLNYLYWQSDVIGGNI